MERWFDPGKTLKKQKLFLPSPPDPQGRISFFELRCGIKGTVFGKTISARQNRFHQLPEPSCSFSKSNHHQSELL